MDYRHGYIPMGAQACDKALEAAIGYADHLSAAGATILWVRGIQRYDPYTDFHIARADVQVAGTDGIPLQFGCDSFSDDPTFPHAFFDTADRVVRLYRIHFWANAVRAALVPLLIAEFPRWDVHISPELTVTAASRDGDFVEVSKIPRKMRGFIAGFVAAWKLTAPHPDTAQTSPGGSAPTAPPPAQPE